MNENELNETAENLSEIEIAELANKELRAKNEEIMQLKKELAKSKLYSTADEEETISMTREECIERINDCNCSNYDYVEAVCNLTEIELAEGKPNPLGEDGEKVYNFFKECLDECGDDKSRFTSVYQSRIGADDPKVVMSRKNRK